MGLAASAAMKIQTYVHLRMKIASIAGVVTLSLIAILRLRRMRGTAMACARRATGA
jgi:hypothetical protein